MVECSGSLNVIASGNKVNNKVRRLIITSSAPLKAFNAEIEAIDDYKEHLDFHCTANQVAEGH